jgi:hypothetical protein
VGPPFQFLWAALNMSLLAAGIQQGQADAKTDIFQKRLFSSDFEGTSVILKGTQPICVWLLGI